MQSFHLRFDLNEMAIHSKQRRQTRHLANCRYNCDVWIAECCTISACTVHNRPPQPSFPPSCLSAIVRPSSMDQRTGIQVPK